MKTEIGSHAPAVGAVTAAELVAAHADAQRAISTAAGVSLYGGTIYEPIRQRFEKIRLGWGRPHAAAPLLADLREITAATPVAVQRMISRGAERLHGDHPATERYRAALAAEAQGNDLRPKVSARELITRLAQRGVMIREVDGSLHATPAAALLDADREALRINKDALLAELARVELI